MTQPQLGWGARSFVALQHRLPQHLLSGLMYRLARVRWRPLKDLLILALLRLYRIDMREAAEPNPRAYPHFNAFFTRALAPGARPLDPAEDAILSPVDGTISQLGVIEDGGLIQAKGQTYHVVELLGGDLERARAFQSGTFATIYLAPSNYHRIHMPLGGTLEWMAYVPGRLFSVNATTAALVPGLFARNERVVCGFESVAGQLVMVLVGAIFVGGIETVWAGEVTPARVRSQDPQAPRQGEVRLERGAEMGRFNLGSTVILLFEPGRMTWSPGLAPGDSVRLGQRLGRLNTGASAAGVAR